MNLWILVRKARRRFIYLLYTPINKIRLRMNGCKYGSNLSINGNLYIYRHYETSTVSIGNAVSINSAGWANPIGYNTKTCFQLFRYGRIEIGDGCGISNTAFSSASCIKLGNDVMIGAGCKLYDTDFHPLGYTERVMPGNQEEFIHTKPIIIDDGAFIGAGSIILKGVHIGKHSIVGAGSVVTKNIPANEIWAGNPARFVRTLE